MFDIPCANKTRCGSPRSQPVWRVCRFTRRMQKMPGGVKLRSAKKVTICHFIPDARCRLTEQFCRSTKFSLTPWQSDIRCSICLTAPNAYDRSISAGRVRTRQPPAQRDRSAANAFIDVRSYSTQQSATFHALPFSNRRRRFWRVAPWLGLGKRWHGSQRCNG